MGRDTVLSSRSAIRAQLGRLGAAIVIVDDHAVRSDNVVMRHRGILVLEPRCSAAILVIGHCLAVTIFITLQLH